MKRLCCPIYKKKESGKRDSDPRPQPWQGCALPTELFPLISSCSEGISLDCGCKGTTFFRTAKTFQRFFSKKVLIHPIEIVFITKLAQDFQFSVRMKHRYRRMSNAIKRTGLHRGIVNHILENHLLAYLQFVVETP